MKCVCRGVCRLEEEWIEREDFLAASLGVGNAHSEEFNGESIVLVSRWTEKFAHL